MRHFIIFLILLLCLVSTFACDESSSSDGDNTTDIDGDDADGDGVDGDDIDGYEVDGDGVDGDGVDGDDVDGDEVDGDDVDGDEVDGDDVDGDDVDGDEVDGDDVDGDDVDGDEVDGDDVDGDDVDGDEVDGDDVDGDEVDGDDVDGDEVDGDDADGDIEGVCSDNEDCATSDYCNFAECDDATGQCTGKPTICPDIWAPVCGCDGSTYGNDCNAALAGVSVDYEGQCTEPSCSDNEDCTTGKYCNFAECDDASGECEAKPEMCPLLYDPVCGCDGNTYDNSCLAAKSGVSVDFEGACPTSCRNNGNCSEGYYCLLEDCNDSEGECAAKPTICPDVWAPVCGCDGNTYGNDCLASKSGVSVDYEGECTSSSCFGNGDCNAEEYCYFSDCAQETGECVDKPITCMDIWAPVCGCDGNTYDNACYAAQAGVSVNYDGQCIIQACYSNISCDPDEYCLFVDCAQETGGCTDRPGICLDIWDPVCSCSGDTYDNACFAADDGESVDYKGVCK